MTKKRPRLVPGWDDYFMTLCFFVATRSKDPSTQHGAVLVDNKHHILSTGYNGLSDQISDNDIDWNRPHKYPFIIHAEQNAIDHYFGPTDLLPASTLYVTGIPCSECMKRIVGKKIFKVIYGPQSSNMVDETDWKISREHAKLAHVTIERYCGNLNWVRDRIAWMEAQMGEVFDPLSPVSL